MTIINKKGIQELYTDQEILTMNTVRGDMNVKQKFDFLFVDFMVEDSHRVYCNAIMKAINERSSSVVIEKMDYIDYQEDEQHKVHEIETREIVGNYPIKARVNTVYNYLKTLNIAKKYEFKKIVVLGYDPVMFSFMYKTLIGMGELFIVEHHQLDEVSVSKWKRRLWDSYKLKVNHILLDKSIVEITSNDFSIPSDKIYVFPHPCMFERILIEKKNENTGEIKVLCISQSNDANQMKELVEYERKTRFFEKNNIKLVIRYNESLLVDGLTGFVVIKGFLPEPDYKRLNEECDIVLMLFPLEYRYRCSGTLIDALAAGKKVISSAVPESIFYARTYPALCRTYNKVEDIGKIILDIIKDNGINSDRQHFFEDQKEMSKKIDSF